MNHFEAFEIKMWVNAQFCIFQRLRECDSKRSANNNFPKTLNKVYFTYFLKKFVCQFQFLSEILFLFKVLFNKNTDLLESNKQISQQNRFLEKSI